MTLSGLLAERSVVPPTPRAQDYLRALTLGNGAAALGYPGSANRVLAGLPFDIEAPSGAAFALAARLHARTQDDFHPPGRAHVGAVTLAATLALADRVNDRLLECLAAGYEVMCAIARVYSGDAQRRGYRPTGVFGPFGAAASASAAIGLDKDGIANAIGLAAARSSGTNQSWVSGTDEWLLEVGSAARAGVEASLLTEAGVVASQEALEGASGWARAYFGDDRGERLASALADDASYIHEIAQKPYPVSGIAQVPTWMACKAHESLETFPDAVVVRLPPSEVDYPGTSATGPFRSRSSALMSVVFCVTCGLADGYVRLDRLERPQELVDLVPRVHLISDADLTGGEAVLELEVDSATRRTETQASAILYATWEELVRDGAELAARSEAPAAQVADLRIALSADYPDALTIAQLLREGS